tara:strand:+ start:1680 stop:1910 length:231 start_codon:yes stop_codon:yes gene_type:complete
MGSKDTISAGKEHHLFQDRRDGESIFLEVENIDFEVDPDRVAVKIPLDIWNQMVDDYRIKHSRPFLDEDGQLELDF